MSSITLLPASAHGALAAPPSKSAAHRALIVAALSGSGCVHPILPSEDMEATLRCLCSLGLRFEREGDAVTFIGQGGPQPLADCGESGSTLRFFIPLFAAFGQPVTFQCHGRLAERPLSVYASCLPPHGVTLIRDEAAGTIAVSGQLRSGRFEVAGDVSSQFVTGLLFSLPLVPGDSAIVFTSPLQSGAYVDMTLTALNAAGIVVRKTPDGFAVPGGQTYRPGIFHVGGDWSQAAFLLGAGALGGEITLSGLDSESMQGDKAIAPILSRFGASITQENDTVSCRKAPLRGCDIDMADIPDLLPVLAIIAGAATGDSLFYNAARLRLKESDRLSGAAAMLRALGVSCEETADTLLVHGRGRFSGGTVDGKHDHRLVMAAAIAAFAAKGDITVTDKDSVNKSWPSFWQDYAAIGGQYKIG
ncbi:MAG: 3-phosphoshikimate 1-carboxyvinyltransferase [Clostridia bacterium]|nr:3-phosphoshikimate 1-carboxyvinyltransferase [Clostridia bacterium]